MNETNETNETNEIDDKLYHGHHIMCDYIGLPLSIPDTIIFANKTEYVILNLLHLFSFQTPILK